LSIRGILANKDVSSATTNLARKSATCNDLTGDVNPGSVSSDIEAEVINDGAKLYRPENPTPRIVLAEEHIHSTCVELSWKSEFR
jgi:hypothetical protein